MFGIFPQDEFYLTDGPESVSISASGGWDIVVQPDPSRVFISFSGNASNIFFLQPTIALTGGAVQAGICLSQNSPVYTLTYPLHGPMCAQGWSMISFAGAVLFVTSLFLRRPPQMYGYDTFVKAKQPVDPPNGPLRQRGAAQPSGIRRATVLPRALRERLPGILGEE